MKKNNALEALSLSYLLSSTHFRFLNPFISASMTFSNSSDFYCICNILHHCLPKYSPPFNSRIIWHFFKLQCTIHIGCQTPSINQCFLQLGEVIPLRSGFKWKFLICGKIALNHPHPFIFIFIGKFTPAHLIATPSPSRLHSSLSGPRG
jgi:hypothetical protein